MQKKTRSHRAPSCIFPLPTHTHTKTQQTHIFDIHLHLQKQLHYSLAPHYRHAIFLSVHTEPFSTLLHWFVLILCYDCVVSIKLNIYIYTRSCVVQCLQLCRRERGETIWCNVDEANDEFGASRPLIEFTSTIYACVCVFLSHSNERNSHYYYFAKRLHLARTTTHTLDHTIYESIYLWME